MFSIPSCEATVISKGKGPEELPADDEIPEADEEDGDALEPGKQMPKNNGGEAEHYTWTQTLQAGFGALLLAPESLTFDSSFN